MNERQHCLGSGYSWTMRALTVMAACLLPVLLSGTALAGGKKQQAGTARSGSAAGLRSELKRSKESLQAAASRVSRISEAASASAEGEAGRKAGAPPSGAEEVRAEMAELRALLERSLAMFERLSSRVEALEETSAQPNDAAPQQDEGERIDDIEERLEEISDRIGSRAVVNAFDAEKLDIGGFYSQSFTSVIGDEESESSFNQSQFELLLRAQINKDWSFFGAFGFLRESDLDFSDPERPNFRGFANRTPQIIAWANYRYDDSFQLRLGRFVTPHGIINIEHFAPQLLETNQPQFLRPFSGATLFPNFVSGALVHGKAFVGSQGDTLEYNAYGGAFNGGDADDFVGGLRIAYRNAASGLTFGGNYHGGRRTAGTGPLGHFSLVGNRSLTTNNYQVAGADVLWDQGRFLWKNEAFFSFEDGFDDRVAAYTQPAIRVDSNGKWLVFYRYDYLDPGQGLTDSIEHAIGLNFLPIPTIRIRGVYFYKNFENPETEANLFQISATFSF